MLFMMYCLDKTDSLDIRLSNRQAHLNYIRGISNNIHLAGPILGDDAETMQGSLFILEAETIEAVRTINANDPYQKAGLFAHVEIHPFKKVIGD